MSDQNQERAEQLGLIFRTEPTDEDGVVQILTDYDVSLGMFKKEVAEKMIHRLNGDSAPQRHRWIAAEGDPIGSCQACGSDLYEDGQHDGRAEVVMKGEHESAIEKAVAEDRNNLDRFKGLAVCAACGEGDDTTRAWARVGELERQLAEANEENEELADYQQRLVRADKECREAERQLAEERERAEKAELLNFAWERGFIINERGTWTLKVPILGIGPHGDGYRIFLGDEPVMTPEAEAALRRTFAGLAAKKEAERDG